MRGTDAELSLDSGGFGRLDISDLNDTPAETEDTAPASAQAPCDWCGEGRSGGDYLVVADNRHFAVCTTCWGRSAGYIEMRHSGLDHDTALQKVAGVSKA